HGQVGQALIELSGDQLSQNSARIAAHLEQANKQIGARPYLEMAGDFAASQIAYAEALEKYGRSLSYWLEDALADRLRLHFKREDILSRQIALEAWAQELATIKELAHDMLATEPTQVRPQIEYAIRQTYYDKAIDQPSVTLLEEALETAVQHQQSDLEAEIHFTIGLAYHATGKLALAEKALGRAITQAEANGNQDLVGRAHEWLGPCLAFQGAPIARIRHSLLKAYEYGKHIGDRRLEAGSLEKLAYLFILQGEGDPKQTEAYFANALHIINELGIVQERVIWGAHFGWFYVLTGNYDKAIHYLTEAEEKATQSQLAHFFEERQRIFAFLFMNSGDYDQANKYVDHVLGAQSASPSQAKKGWIAGTKGHIKYLHGDFVESLTYLDEAIFIAKNLNDTRLLAWNLKRRGMVLIALERYAEAEKCLLEAIERQQSLGQSNRALMGVAGLADLALAQEDFETACQHTEKILAHLENEQLDATNESLAVYMSAYHVLNKMGDERAEAMLFKAWDQVVGRANSISDAVLKQTFWAAPPHAELRKIMKP
ncbi:MAG: hypothetical protein AAF614_29415, partial [Chloroflexota bacterium]